MTTILIVILSVSLAVSLYYNWHLYHMVKLLQSALSSFAIDVAKKSVILGFAAFVAGALANALIIKRGEGGE